MMKWHRVMRRLPGWIATGFLILLTTAWTVWGFGEVYYEGWWGSWTNRLPYLVPGVVFWGFAAVALARPRLGGWLMVVVGGGFFFWWMYRGNFALQRLPTGLLLGGLAAVVGLLFLLEARRVRSASGKEQPVTDSWLRRNARYVITFTPPLLAAAAMTVLYAPLLMSRVDDGDRGARLIAGEGVELVWAPAGPGWSAGIDESAVGDTELAAPNVSWMDIALYGKPPVGFSDKSDYEPASVTATDMRQTGLCRFLTEDGTALAATAQDIWRMPTTHEIVRSLVRAGEAAGCRWDASSAEAECREQPNKDTPLWIPDASAIYLLAAEEYDEDSAWYVPYTGGGLYGGAISGQRKTWGNPRHGFRCVREP